MSSVKKTIKIRIQDGKPFYILRANPLIRACEKREEFHKQMIFAKHDIANYSLSMIHWNRKMIELIRMNQEIKENEMPLNLKKKLVQINEKILNQLNDDLSPTLYKWLKPQQYRRLNYRLIYIEFHDERPPEMMTPEYRMHKIQRQIETIIRKNLKEENGVPSLKTISIFAQYRNLIGSGSEHSYSFTIKNHFSNNKLLDF